MNTFTELELISPLRHALADENYDTPTPIQAETIPAALQGFDVMGCAQTGTGKTAAFALPILNALGSRNRKAIPNRPFALVLAPTRELAIQIEASFATYGRYLKIRRALVYGGVSQGKQVRSLDRGVHLLIATPGRLLDLLDQGHMKLDRLEMFVLDEADRMLDMGFLPDLKRIMALLPDDRQSLFFSATLPAKIIQLSQRLLTDPVAVNVTPKSKSLDSIEQRVLLVERSQKHLRLQETLRAAGVGRAIVFTRTKRSADVVARKLKESGIRASAIHGNKSQNVRQRVLEAFRRDRLQVLVATDVAARGIDIDGITHIINFDLPSEPENYLHRIGRTGRAGATGVAVTFCAADQIDELRAIERLIGKTLLADSEQKRHHPGKRQRTRPARTRRPAAMRDSPGAAGARRNRKQNRRRNGPKTKSKQQKQLA